MAVIGAPGRDVRTLHRSFWVLATVLALGGCSSIPRWAIPTVFAPEDEETAEVARLQAQGFTIVEDGRGRDAASALRYQGTPAGVVACRSPDGRLAAADQAAEVQMADGLHVLTQRGEVDAYVVVENSGAVRGLYVNHVLTSILLAADGSVVARQFEEISFPPSGTGQFRNGLTCQAVS
jgi:hypothetical protein